MPNDNSIIFQLELDYDFTDEEIRHIAKHLKKNKATGDDNILNEYIYSTIDLFLPVYEKLFNYTLHIGKVPHDWVIDNIVIYKMETPLTTEVLVFQVVSANSSQASLITGSAI